jgi:hypothetical protein
MNVKDLRLMFKIASSFSRTQDARESTCRSRKGFTSLTCSLQLSHRALTPM